MRFSQFHVIPFSELLQHFEFNSIFNPGNHVQNPFVQWFGWLVEWVFMAQGPKRTCCATQKSLKENNDKKKGKEEYIHKDNTHTYKYKRSGWGLPSRNS